MHGRPNPVILTVILIVTGCAAPTPTPSGSPSSQAVTPAATASSSPTPASTRVVHTSYAPVATGTPIQPADLSGRIVTDDFEDVFALNVDGSDFVRVADDPAGPEFDGSWSPDGKWVVYRDSTRGLNKDDEIYIASADGTHHRNLTNNPANDWGPDWSPDGKTIAFNSERDHKDGTRGYLVNPDGSNLRRIEVDKWSPPTWSPN